MLLLRSDYVQAHAHAKAILSFSTDVATIADTHTYLPAWKTRLVELKRLCEQGRAKVKAAQRIPTIFDTSLVKHWTPELVKPRQEEKEEAEQEDMHWATPIGTIGQSP